MTRERVYATWDYWDGIRSGFADFRGTPHYFAATWAESDEDYTHVFELTPVSQETIALVAEHSAIFDAWAKAFRRGEATETSHPAVAGQNDRFVELEQTIHSAIAATEAARRRMVGRFEALPGQEHLPPGVFREVAVEWSEP